MTAGYSTASSGSCDPGRHGAIYLMPSARILPATTASFVGDEQVWATIMNALAGAHNAAVQMIDTSIVRVHQHRACINRNRRQCMGRSCGGLTSKIHALVDSNGLPVRLALTPGEAHDNRLAGKLLSRKKPESMLLADRGYDADWIRELAMKKGAGPTSRPNAIAASRSVLVLTYIAPAIELRGSSTGSSNVVGWRPVTTNLPPTTSPSFNSPQSGYGSVLMSPRPTLLWQIYWIDRLNWIPESDFQ